MRSPKQKTDLGSFLDRYLMLIITGMPGAGKDEFVKVAKKKGYIDVHMGDTVKSYAKKESVPVTDKDIGKFASGQRSKFGMDVWARRTGENITDPAKTVVDGLRNIEELQYFRENFPDVIVVAIYTNKEERLRRILRRHRPDDVTSEYELDGRDDRELGWGIGRTISLADKMIINDKTLEEFKEKARSFLDEITQ